MRISLFFVVILLFTYSNSQSQCVHKQTVFEPGERLTYKGYYNWGFVWLNTAEVEFTISQKHYLNKNVFQFEVNGKSLPNYDKLFKVRDRFQSYVDMETFAPAWSERNTDDGGFIAHETYNFNANGRKIYAAVENSDTKYYRDTLFSFPCTFDLISAVYYCRTIDFEKYTKTDKIPVRVIVDGKQYSLYLRYLGKEVVALHNDTRKFRCIKFSALMIEGTVFKAGESMMIWITDDKNRVPVQVQAKIIIGSVKGILNTTEGLLNESTALVK